DAWGGGTLRRTHATPVPAQASGTQSNRHLVRHALAPGLLGSAAYVGTATASRSGPKPVPPCATPTKPPGRRPCDVLLEQAMDGLRPVSRAMDGATEPASKHITRAPLAPEPPPPPWCDNPQMSENSPHIA